MAMNKGKSPMLPPKTPIRNISSSSSSYTEYIPISARSSKALPKPRDSTPRLHEKTSNGNPLETDTKQGKKQVGQRSKVNKLQYIAELERSVQALRTESFDASAEMEFANQRYMFLTKENKVLKQRFQDLSEEQPIKSLEYEMLDREVRRLRSLCQHQQQMLQQPPQTGSSQNRRANSRDHSRIPTRGSQ